MELPFPLRQDHKSKTNYEWRMYGLVMDKFEDIYQRYIYSSHCELCKKAYKECRDRCMDHDHETGEFRNICCQRCNHRRKDVKIRTDNTSGYKNISKLTSKTCNQGFLWRFSLKIDGKHKQLKTSVDLEKVIQFRDQWFKDNPDFHT